MKINRDSLYRSIFYVFTGVFLLVFYTRCYPLILASPDDWRYINYWRDFAFATLGRGWNPGRVLPESLMPIGGNLGVYVIGPLVHDSIGFIREIAIGVSIPVIIAIVFYLYSFGRLLRKRLNVGIRTELFLTLVFFLFHFWIFRSAQSHNTYLFDGLSPNLYYFYVIPVLLNFSACFIWVSIGDGESLKKLAPAPKSAFWVMIYFSVFSNLFTSVVIAVFAGLRCLITLIWHREDSFKKTLYAVRYEAVILLMWLYSMAAEAMGGNAAHVTASAEALSFAQKIRNVITDSFELLLKVNKYFALLCAVLIVVLIIRMISNTKLRNDVLFITAHAATVYIYQILLGCVVGPEYISRAMVSATFLIDLLILDILAINEIISIKREAVLLAPLFVIVVISMINTREPVFNASASEVIPLERLDGYYVDTVVEADRNGLDTVTISAPKWYPYLPDDPDGLYSTYISSTLYKYGLTSRKMTILFDGNN